MRRSPLARPVLARTATALVAAVLVTGVLTGCSGFSLDGGCAPAFESGDASSAVAASGDVGDSPAVEFPTPLIADEVQRSVLTAGSGEPAETGSVIRYTATYYIGETGEALPGTEDVFGVASDAALGLGEALECAAAGTRITVVGPAEQIDAQYAGNTETLVAVIDVESVYLGKANGVNQLPQDGMPTVVTAVDGQPGITLTYQSAPEESRLSIIKAGSGATVREGDTVLYHGRNWSWPAGVGSSPSLGQLDTWTAGAPQTIDVDPEIVNVEAVYDAFEGTKVGSQVLLVVPNDTGDGGATVIVLDILGILSQG